MPESKNLEPEHVQFEITQFDSTEFDNGNLDSNISLTANTTPEIESHSIEVLTDPENLKNHKKELLKSDEIIQMAFDEVKDRIFQVLKLIGDEKLIQKNHDIFDLKNWQYSIFHDKKTKNSKIFWKINKQPLNDNKIDKKDRALICGSQKVQDLREFISFEVDIQTSVDPELLKQEKIRKIENFRKKEKEKKETRPITQEDIDKKYLQANIEYKPETLEMESDEFIKFIQDEGSKIFSEDFNQILSNPSCLRDLKIISEKSQEYFDLLNKRTSNPQDPSPREILFKGILSLENNNAIKIETFNFNYPKRSINELLNILDILHEHNELKEEKEEKKFNNNQAPLSIIRYALSLILNEKNNAISRQLKDIVIPNIKNFMKTSEWTKLSEQDKLEALTVAHQNSSEKSIIGTIANQIFSTGLYIAIGFENKILSKNSNTSKIEMRSRIEDLFKDCFPSAEYMEKVIKLIMGDSYLSRTDLDLQKSFTEPNYVPKRDPKVKSSLLPGLGENPETYKKMPFIPPKNKK